MPAAENGLHSFCPDKDTWIDYVWCRAEEISTDNNVGLRLLVVNNGQKIATAYQGGQWLTASLSIGNSSSISSDPWGDGAIQQPLVPDTLTELPLSNRAVGPTKRIYNKVPAGGLLVAVATENPAGLVNLVIGIRCRERSLG